MQRFLTILQNYLNQIHMPNLRWTDIVEILILAFLIYHILLWIKNTRAWSLLKGLLVIGAFVAIAAVFNMSTILWIVQHVTGLAVTAIVILLQPELRSAMEELGQTNFLSSLFNVDYTRTPEGRFSDKTVNEIVRASLQMSKVNTGALIVIEQTTPLQEYARTGIDMDALVTSQLLINIFEKNTPLHDGAVIVRKNRVIAATCYLPLSENRMDKNLGTRHRAGVGISEVTDSLTIIVSEETGEISLAYRGALTRNVTEEMLRERLVTLQNKEVQEARYARLLSHNWGLKLISLVFAACLWFFVTNYQDPETVLTVNNVPVKLLHTDSVTQEGKVCIVLNDSDTIPVVTVTAPRSVVDSLGAENIVATADVADIGADNTVPIVLTTNKYSDSITSIVGSSKAVFLSIEDQEQASFTIEAAVTGNVADGYEIGSISLEQNQVRVKGPASEVEKVKSAGVTVDVSGAENSISTNAEIHLYDEDGVDLDIDKHLELNIDKVMVNVEILSKKEVPVKIAVSGTPAEGFRLTGETTVEPGRIMVSGRRAALEKVSEISIPSAELNVTGRTKTMTKTFIIANYLPDGVQLAEGELDTVKVTVEIVAIGEE